MAELETVLTRRREEVEAKGASYTKDRSGRADAVWYERTEGQFSPRHSDRPVSRLASASPFGLSREPSEPPPEMPPRPNLVRRRSTDATLQRTGMEPDRVRRSFPRRTSTGTALKAPVRPMNSRNASPARSLTPLSRAASSDKGSAAEAQAKPQEAQEAASKRAESTSSASTISCEAVAVPKRALPKSPPRAKAKAGNRKPGVASDASRGAGPKASSSGPRPKSKSEVRRPGAAKAKAAIQLPGTESRGGSTSSTQPEVTQNSGDGSKHSGEEQEAAGACSPMTPTTPILETIKRRHVKLSTIESVGNVQDDTPPAALASALPGLPDEASASQGEEESPIDSAVGHVTTCFSSWRQLSLGSMSSGGLPTILTHLSESKKGIENEEPPEPEAVEAAEAPTPCAEPEPAPSPDGNLPWQPEGFAGAAPRLDVRPALVINIPPGDNNALHSEEVNPTLSAPAGAQLDEREYRLLWESVVQGDIQMLQEFMTRGRLQSGRLCDMNGHSIFWNALAYQQQEVAMFLLRHFPPGSEQGVDLWEVHQRRKDTLLHLCVYFQYFSAPVAELFEVLFLGVGQVDTNSFQAYWNRTNGDSDTFLHCAAARRNFWVMRYVASHAGEILFRNGRTSALEVLLEKLEEVGVSCPTADFPEIEVKRSWMDFSRYLPMAERTAFADMELEVQQSTGTYRVPAHRCVLGAASGVLHQELSAAGRVLLIDPLSCRSSKVLDTVLTFIYSSQISCDYREDGCLLWQLLCLCARYQLPEPLWRYARSALLLAVKNAVFTAVATIPLLLEAKREVGLSESEACFIAHVYLRSAEASEALRDTSPKCNEDQKLGLHLSEGPNIVCGDTTSDLPMVLAALRLMCGDKVVDRWQARLRQDDATDEPQEEDPSSDAELDEAAKEEAERKAREEEEEEKEARKVASKLAVLFVITPDSYHKSKRVADQVLKWCELSGAQCSIIPAPDVLVYTLAKYAEEKTGTSVTFHQIGDGDTTASDKDIDKDWTVPALGSRERSPSFELPEPSCVQGEVSEFPLLPEAVIGASNGPKAAWAA